MGTTYLLLEYFVPTYGSAILKGLTASHDDGGNEINRQENVAEPQTISGMLFSEDDSGMLFSEDDSGIVFRSKNSLARMMADFVTVCASFGLPAVS